MKLVYTYDYQGKFIGKTEAELCQITEIQRANQKEGDTPIEAQFIMPAYSTELEPPEVDSNQNVFFIDGAWVIKNNPIPEEKPIAVEEIKPEEVLTYVQKRFSEYPSMLDYLDGIVKDDAAQIQKYIDDCKAIKLKYPKV